MALVYERIRFQAMGSPCAIHMYVASRDEACAVADEAVAEVRRLEAKYTRFRDDSLTSEINRSAGSAAGVEVDDETASLLDYAATCHVQSEGRFDITAGVLRRVWDFKSGRIPEQPEIDRVLELVGWAQLEWERPRLVLPRDGMQLDFGGFVKEYAVDRVAQLCRDAGLRHGLVDLGGDLAVVGPHPDGAPWQVGIRDPMRPDTALARIPLAKGAMATSGDYERCMLVDGKRYTHVLDPRTGWPVEGLSSVTAIAPHCLVAGSASTFSMLFGPSEAATWLDELGLPNLRVETSGVVSGSLTDFVVSSRAPGVPSAAAELPSLLERVPTSANAPTGL